MGFNLSFVYGCVYSCVVDTCSERIHNRMTEAEAHKLKHGATIKCINADACELISGKLYTVDKVVGDDSGYVYISLIERINTSRNYDNDNAYSPARFELKPKRVLGVDESWKDERDEVFVLNTKRFRNGEVAQRQRR